MAVKKVSSNELHTINLKIVSVRQSKKAASHWMRMNPNSWSMASHHSPKSKQNER